MSGGHRPEATAPTEAAAETQASPTVRFVFVRNDTQVVPYEIKLTFVGATIGRPFRNALCERQLNFGNQKAQGALMPFDCPSTRGLRGLFICN